MGMVVSPFWGTVPTGTPHRYWRVYITSNSDGIGVQNVVIGELEMRETSGGSDQCNGGTASASDSFSGSYLPGNAFANDGDTNRWGSAVTNMPHWIAYDFGSGVTKSINEIAIMGANDSGNALTESPGAFKVQSSDDGSTWTDEWWVGYPGGSNGHGYGGDTFKVFTRPAVEQAPSANRHRYWRVSITGSNGGSYVGARTIEMRVVAGGPDETEGGTGTSLSNFSGLPPTNSFGGCYPGNTNEWASNNVGFPEWIKYDFGSGNAKQITQIAYQARASVHATQSPTGFDVQWSDDNSSWTTLWSESGLGGGWGSATLRVFTKP